MAQIIEAVDIDARAHDVYSAWSDFASFPSFLDDVDELTEASDSRFAWKVTIDGVTREFTTEITERVPDERLGWTATGGSVDHAGVITFEPLTDTTSRATVQIDWAPEGLVEDAGDILGIPKRAVRKELNLFKEHVEAGHSAA